VWTGDSARHASGDVPRTEAQVLDANRRLADMFAATFASRGSAASIDNYGRGHGHHDDVGGGGDDDVDDSDAGRGSIGDHDSLAVPVVPTIGNNDVLPHNEMRAGPNRWTRAYLDIWRKFIPRSQRPTFEQGGWFFVEVIPDRLAVFSLNTMYALFIALFF
jgi:endopolyphosphatase